MKNIVGITHIFAVCVLFAVISIALVSHKRSSLQASALPYSDVDWLSQEGIAIHFLASRGIINGFPDGTFRGYEQVNRVQAVKMMILAGFIPVTHTMNNGMFTDIAEGEWYTPYVVTAAFRKIVRGTYSSQTEARFEPRKHVNTAEFLAMLGRTFHLEKNWLHGYHDIPQSAWYKEYAGSAWHYDLFPNRLPYLEPHRPLSRNEFAVALYTLFHQPDQKRGLPWWKPPELPDLVKIPHEPASKNVILHAASGNIIVPTGSTTGTGSIHTGTGSGTGSTNTETGSIGTGEIL